MVTGANGFIGAHLAQRLVDRGDEVTCLVRRTSNVERIEPLPVSLAYGDITDVDSLSEPISGTDVVYHLGATIRALSNRQYYRVNEGGTENVARVCAGQEKPPVMVLVSSLSAVAPSEDGTPIREDHPSAPVSHYGLSKRAAERVARRYADRVPITVVRAAGVFGEADRSCLPMFKPIFQFGVHVYPAPLCVSMIHCADLVELIILAAERGRRIDPKGRAEDGDAKGFYFGACDEYPTYREFGQMIGRALGRDRVRMVAVPSALVWSLASFNELTGQVIRRPHIFALDRCRDATAGCWFCSPQAAVDDLGFRPKASLAERLRQTADWYRTQGWL